MSNPRTSTDRRTTAAHLQGLYGLVNHLVKETLANEYREDPRSQYSYTNNKHTDSSWYTLCELLSESVVLEAVHLIENQRIVLIKDQAETIRFIQVHSLNDVTFLLIPNVNWCACAAYTLKVVTHKRLMCAHMFASQLATAYAQRQPQPSSMVSTSTNRPKRSVFECDSKILFETQLSNLFAEIVLES